MPKIPECVGVARLLYETLRERHRCLLYSHNRDWTARVHWDCECGWMDDTV